MYFKNLNIKRIVIVFILCTNFSCSKDFRRDEIKGAGVVGSYYTTEYPISLGSEEIQIITYSKERSREIMKEVKSLKRKDDYSIDYSNGSITFNKPIPTFDQDRDPLFVIKKLAFYRLFELNLLKKKI